MRLLFAVNLFTIMIWIREGGASVNKEEPLQEPYSYYEKGVHATTLLERQKAFNQALYLYKKLEPEVSDPFASGQLEVSIADNYFQLGEYAHAILYYYRALKLIPYSEAIRKHLELAQEKLALSPSAQIPLFDRIISFNLHFNFSDRLRFFFWSALLTTLVGSAMIWLSRPLFKRLYHLMILLSALICANLLATIYFSPLEAVVVEPLGIYRDPNVQQPQLQTLPLAKGMKIIVLDVQKGGKWLKIKVNDTVGYVPARSIILI